MLSPQKVFLHVLRELLLMLLQCSMLGMLSPKKVFLHVLRGLFLMLLQWGMDCLVSNGAWLGLVSVNA